MDDGDIFAILSTLMILFLCLLKPLLPVFWEIFYAICYFIFSNLQYAFIYRFYESMFYILFFYCVFLIIIIFNMVKKPYRAPFSEEELYNTKKLLEEEIHEKYIQDIIRANAEKQLARYEEGYRDYQCKKCNLTFSSKLNEDVVGILGYICPICEDKTERRDKRQNTNDLYDSCLGCGDFIRKSSHPTIFLCIDCTEMYDTRKKQIFNNYEEDTKCDCEWCR